MKPLVGNEVAIAGDARLLYRGPLVDPFTSYPFVMNSRVINCANYRIE
jgi:hypothetical protein